MPSGICSRARAALPHFAGRVQPALRPPMVSGMWQMLRHHACTAAALLPPDCAMLCPAPVQPVWMVINLQGKIKGSYTAEKMIEFTRRGTLGGAQLALGMDRNLPYNARQVRGSVTLALTPGAVDCAMWC